VRLASSIIRLLEHFFPFSLDKLKDEEAKDEGEIAEHNGLRSLITDPEGQELEGKQAGLEAGMLDNVR